MRGGQSSVRRMLFHAAWFVIIEGIGAMMSVRDRLSASASSFPSDTVGSLLSRWDLVVLHNLVK